MIRALKWLAIAIVALVVLIAGAALIVPHVFDPNDYKDTIADAVMARTGRSLTIKGDLALTVFPWLGVDVGPIEIGQPAGFQGTADAAGQPFLRSQRTQVRVKLLPLLARRIEMDTVTAQGLVLHLATAQDGRTNWDDLLQLTAAAEPAGAPAGGTRPPGIAALALGGLNINQAAVNWHDATTGRRVNVSNLQLTTGAVDLPSPIDVRVNFDVDASDPNLPQGTVRGHVQTLASVAFNQPDKTVSLSALGLTAELHTAQNEEIRLELQANVTVGIETQIIGIPKLALSALSPSFLASAGKVSLSLTDTSADVADLSFKSGGFAVSGELAGALMKAGKVAFSANGSARGSLREGTVKVRGLSVKVPSFEQAGTRGNLELTADLDAALAAQRLTLRGLILTADLTGAAASEDKARLAFKGDVDVDLANRVASSPAIEITSSSFDIAGHAGSFRATGALHANPNDQRFSFSGLAIDGVLERGTSFNGPLPFLVRGDLEVDLTQGQVVGQLWRLESSAFDIDAAKGNLVIELDGPRLDLNRAGLSATGVRARGTVQGKAAFAGSMTMAIDAKGLTASATAASLVRVRVQLPSFDVNRTRGTVDAAGRVDANLENEQITIKSFTAKGQLAGQALQGGKVRFNGAANARYNAKSGSFEVSNLTLALRDLDFQDLQGTVDVSGSVAGSTSNQTYAGKRIRAVGSLEGKAIPGRKLKFDVLSDPALDLAKSSLQISNFSAQAAGVQAQGTMNISNLSSGPRYKGTLAVAPFNPRSVLRRFGLGTIKTADSKALRTLSGRAAIAGGPGRLALENLTMQLDESTARGRISVSGLGQAGSRPQLQFDLTLNGMDADRYLPPAASARKGKPSTISPAAVPFGLLSQFDLEGRLQIGKLKINELRVSNFKLSARGKDGKLELNPVTANLYRGTINARGNIDATQKVPAIAMKQELRGVQAGPLLVDLQGRAAVTGTADFDLDIESRGLTEDQLLGNANGSTRFTLHDGTIEGINIVRTICSKLSRLGVVSEQSTGGNQTPFSDFTGTGQIRRGTVYNEDMAVTSPFLRATGKGNINLVRQQVGYAVTAYLVDSCEGQGRGVVNDLLNVPIPIRITGPVAALRYGFDFDRLFASIAQQQIQKQGTRFLERALGGKSSNPPSGTPSGSGKSGSTAEDAIKGLLKGLFK